MTNNPFQRHRYHHQRHVCSVTTDKMCRCGWWNRRQDVYAHLLHDGLLSCPICPHSVSHPPGRRTGDTQGWRTVSHLSGFFWCLPSGTNNKMAWSLSDSTIIQVPWQLIITPSIWDSGIRPARCVSSSKDWRMALFRRITTVSVRWAIPRRMSSSSASPLSVRSPSTTSQPSGSPKLGNIAPMRPSSL